MTAQSLTPLDRLAPGGFCRDRQWAARLAICQFVRGEDDIGPRYRIGSNAPRPVSELGTCPHCGGEGDTILGIDGREFCPGCREEWVVGDYDWTVLGDVLRYRADETAGLVQEPGRIKENSPVTAFTTAESIT